VATTTISLATGERLQVVGSLEQVAKQLEDATRSGAGTFAWLEDVASGERVGIRPAHVVLIRSTDLGEANDA
jgi:hypothetical protein